MVITIENTSYNTDNILYFNTSHIVMGLYVISIYFKSQENPLVLEYNSETEYNEVVDYLKNTLTIY